MVNVMKTVLYWDRVLAIKGRVISLSALTDSSLKATQGMETDLSWFAIGSFKQKYCKKEYWLNFHYQQGFFS